MSDWGANETGPTNSRTFVDASACTVSPEEPTAYLQRVLHAVKEGTSIAGLLRMGGAGLMVFSLSLFLMQGMDTTSDLHRFLLLLAQTVLLTSAGFAVGYLLKEPRGARVFFSLALISIPANFAVLGAMIYSVAPLDNLVTQYPTFASWQSTDLQELSIAAVTGLAVLVPMSIFCFAVLARHARWWLSIAYLLSSATLLIPLRDTLSITLISSVCALSVLALLSQRHAKRSRLATGEEQFAKALLFIPAAVMLARSAALYHVDFYFGLGIVIAIYYFLRRRVAAGTGNSTQKTSLQILAVTFVFILAIMLTALIISNVAIGTPFPVFTLTWLALNLDLTRFINSRRVNAIVHGLWAVTCFAGIVFDTFIIGNPDGFLINLAVAVVILAASTTTRQRLGAILGTIGIVGLPMLNGAHLFSVVLDTGWAGVAIAGALTIISGSLLERFWPLIKIRLINRFGVVRTDITEIGTPELQDKLPVTATANTSAVRKAA
ncbi:MAG: hypothetical protein AB8B97_03635 [Granulosicoccus sp.]